SRQLLKNQKKTQPYSFSIVLLGRMTKRSPVRFQRGLLIKSSASCSAVWRSIMSRHPEIAYSAGYRSNIALMIVHISSGSVGTMIYGTLMDSPLPIHSLAGLEDKTITRWQWA